MNEDDLCFQSVAEVGKLLRSGTVSCVDLVNAFIARYDRVEEQVNCYASFLPERAVQQATALDKLLQQGIDLGPMHGIPVTIKDNVDTSGIRTTSGSPILRDRVPERDAYVVGSLYAAGAILLGKANLYEWAYGAPSGLFGDVSNPWDTSRTAGASSNGSAAAVAAGLASAAIGTDLGGSIRIPSAMCGIFGLKPEYGTISRQGVAPPGQTLDHVGPMTRTAGDARLLLAASVGRSSASHSRAYGSSGPFRGAFDTQGVRVGIAVPQAAHPVERSVERALAQTTDLLTSIGCRVNEVELPDLSDARTAMWTISAVEGAEAHLELLRQHLPEYAEKPKRLLLGGLLIPGVDYVRCQRYRLKLQEEMNQLLEGLDGLIMPILPRPPWRADIQTTEVDGVAEDNMAAMTHFSPMFNLTGHAAAAFLAGFDEQSLPVALQAIAPFGGTERLLSLLERIENETRYADRRPPLNL